jgi:hypothetical protein
MNDDFELMYYYVRYYKLYYAHIAIGYEGRNRIMYEVNSILTDQVRIITELEKIYNFGLLQSLIVNPKIYQNSLVKARTAKIIRGLTKQ